MRKKFNLYDPQTDKFDKLWIDFANKGFDLTNSDQIVCSLSEKNAQKIYEYGIGRNDKPIECSEAVQQYFKNKENK